MSYQLYNINTNQSYGPIRQHPYTIDGQPGILPPYLVELEVIEESRPVLGRGQSVETVITINLENKTLTRGWNIIEPTQEVLDELDRQDANNIRRIDLTQVKTVLRNRADQLSSFTVTQQNAVQALQQIIDWEVSEKRGLADLLDVLEFRED